MSGKNSKGDSNGGFLRFLWNPDTGEFCGRTGKSWFQITVFYIIFYACLTAFWVIMLVVFYQTLDAFRPRWTLDSSIIGTVPGLGFRPRPPSKNIDSTLVYFKAGGGGNWNHWVNNLNDYVQRYERINTDGEHLVTCSHGGKRAGASTACRFPIEKINANCTMSNTFGYEYGQPCILLKINKIYEWIPEPYPSGNFPKNIPRNIERNYDPNNVYISCEGENMADQENMGQVSYFPNNYIENYYYPFMNVPGYMSPFVFVQFLNPERGVLINIECKAWAANIKHDRMERVGSVHFELMVD